MTKMLMLLIVEDSNSRSKMDQNSDSRAVAKAKEAPRVIKEEKVVRNHVVTVEPTTHLVSAQHMQKTVFSARRKDSILLGELWHISGPSGFSGELQIQYVQLVSLIPVSNVLCSRGTSLKFLKNSQK